MKQIPFILRDHRDELRRHWMDDLVDRVDSDYREIIGSPLGERMLRTFVDELIEYSEAEEYEVPALLDRVERRILDETRHRLSLGFSITDMIVAVHVLRGSIIDVLVDALVLDEMPSFADSLDQLKGVNAFIDDLVRATMAAA